MHVIDLDGTWHVRELDSTEQLPAKVPGCIHLDLLAADKIPDPFWRDNEKQVQWVSERTWIYNRALTVTEELLHCEHVMLRCEGLDTLATIRLNGEKVAQPDNMFRTWEFDVRAQIKLGSNSLEVEFQPPLPHTRELQKRRYIHAWLSREDGVNYIRKEACNYGWDWGPRLVTCGIWKTISLVGWSTARIENVHVTQDHSHPGMVTVGIQPNIVGELATLDIAVTIRGPGNLELRQELTIDPTPSKPLHVSFTLTDPQLWWPNGMGAQPLYTVHVELKRADGITVDAWTGRIGLRTLHIKRENDEAGQSFYFSINGQPFFAKGANWIPADAFATRVTEANYRDLLQSAVHANMNMLRVWGGGIYEQDAFYDICDELGIAVWQDFMFACACYPTFDDAWMENVRAEAEQHVRRLRHHACIALWCGNNELEQGICGPDWSIHQMPWSEAARVFDELLPQVVLANDPQRDYWPGSPHTPIGERKQCNDPGSGDAHLWSVWHGREPFEWYRTSRHRFCSEFGFQSFPEPRTIASFALPEDQNISSYVMDFHQRSWVGNGIIMSYMLSWFRQPKDFESFVWMSQIVQGLAMKYACEHWRRQMPHTMGALYWQLNDTWPGPSWSSIDYFHRWKALHYMARRFFAPVLLSLVEDPSSRTVEVWVTNELRSSMDTSLHVTITDCSGEILHENTQAVPVTGSSSATVALLQIDELVARELDWGHISPVPQITPGGVRLDQGIGPRDIIVWAELESDGAVISRNTVTFAKPKHLELRDPLLVVNWSHNNPNLFAICAKHPALYVWLEIDGVDARFSSNFFDIRANDSMDIEIQCNPSATELQQRLIVHSLFDTY